MDWRTLAKTYLAKCGLHAARLSRNRVSGLDLERDLYALLRTEAPVCFDVGANKGQTILLLQSVFKSPKIFAFEPSSVVFQSLKELQMKHPRGTVKLFQCALGPGESRREFINYEGKTLGSFLSIDHDPRNPFHDMPETSREIVDIRTLDSVVEAELVERIDLLKIDVQGFDLDVLRGAQKSLAEGVIQNVLIEINFGPVYAGQARPHEILGFLSDYKFVLVDNYEKVRNDRVMHWCTSLFARA